MSSLLTYASPWNNDTNSSKKRQPTMRKPNKMRPTVQNIQNIEEPDEYMTFSENFQDLQPSTIDKAQTVVQDRTERVNDLLNKITSADTSSDNSKMGDFKPIEPPSLNVKKDMEDNSMTSQYIPPVPTFPYFNQPSSAASNIASKITPNNNGYDKYSNYNKSYENNNPYYVKMGMGNNLPRDDKLMEKINYMIHLLEQQQNEKTDNVTEEFILYTFLGVFIIFIIDSFSRTGKYNR